MEKQKKDSIEVPKKRLITGTIVLVVGFLSPLLIPWVTTTNWSIGVKSFLSGFLAFGIPEIFILIAIAIMGKQGYEFFKLKVGQFLKPLLPPDRVSRPRYRLGLVLFVIPLLFGFFEPYLAYFFQPLRNPISWYLSLDLVFLISLFVLGGDFWDKLRGLFDHNATICK